MAERTVTVRLRAVVDDYKSAMSSAGKATQDVASQADKWKNLGRSTAALGDSLTRNVTLPIVAVGAAAVKMSLDFDSAFQQMHQLAGVSASEIDGMKESVLGLAGETGKAPTELAEALYFLRSSGLDGAAAMDALEMSAKASAAGMGSTVEIADAVSSAMNAYAESGLTAANATDVLVATAREGKAEPAELAGQMGKLLPIASELGISFQDVGGAIATLSLKGNDAAASSTLLQNVMQKLLRPSQQAQEALAGVGISVDDIRGMIAEKGLLGTLETLKASLGESGFVRFWEDAQAVQGALGIVGGDIDATRDRFAALNDSTGDTDEAFGKWAETMGAKNAQAFAQFQVAMIRLGDVLAPIAADVASFAASVVEGFSKLPKPVQTFVLALAGVAAALGPILSVGGRVISAVSNIAKAFTSTIDFAGRFGSGFRDADAAASAFSGTAGSLGGKLRGLQVAAGVAAGVAGIAGVAIALNQLADARQSAELDDIAEGMNRITGESQESSVAAIKELDNWGKVPEVFDRVLESGAAQAERFIDMAESAGVSSGAIDEMRAALEAKRDADVQAAADSDTNTAAVRESAGAFDEETSAVTETVEALKTYADQLAALFDPLFGMANAAQANQQALADEAAAELELVAARDSGNPLEIAAAEQKLSDARVATGQSAVGLAQAEAILASGIADGSVSVDEAAAKLQEWRDEGRLTQADVDVLAARFGIYADSVRDVPEQAGVEVTADTAPAEESLRQAKDHLFDWGRSSGTARVDGNPNPARAALRTARDGLNSWGRSRGTGTADANNRPAIGQINVARGGLARWGASSGTARILARDGASGVISSVGSRLRALDGSHATVTVTTREIIQSQPGTRPNRMPVRAHGGPVLAGESYIVGEEGPEILTMGPQGGTVLPHDVLAGHMTAGSSPVAGGGGDSYYLDLRGAITPDSASLEKVVYRAIARGGERGRPLTVRGRRL